MSKGRNTKPFPANILPVAAAAAREAWCGRGTKLGGLCLGGFCAEVRATASTLWIILRSPSGAGLALRGSHHPEGTLRFRKDGEGAFVADAEIGRFETSVREEEGVLRVRTTLTPKEPIAISHFPRDLFPFEADGELAAGEVLAAQRGLNGGVLFARVQGQKTESTEFGSFLYVQNLTALNPYFNAIGLPPHGAVGGEWPELGYLPPCDATKPLAKGESFVLSDAILVPSPVRPDSDKEQGMLFLELLERAYPYLEGPAPEYRDWPDLARRTLRDLARSSRATVEKRGSLFVRPYLGAEEPDAMSQLAVCTPAAEWLRDEHAPPSKLVERLRAGVSKFHDGAPGILRRNLPGTISPEEADVVDSWYLFHPLLNLSRWAMAGDEEARDLVEAALPYVQKAARHFKYDFPIKFRLSDFSVVTRERKPGEPGQSDLGGVYAYIMLQAAELFGRRAYRTEAARALRTSPGGAFEGEYQANLTAWGIAAGVRLWREAGDEEFRDCALLALANFLQNSVLWDSELKAAKHYSTFLGATCLHDAPYMAAYECFESAGAFTEALDRADGMLPEYATRFMAEFIRYGLSRAWSFYPEALPEEAIADETKNGKLDRRLAFPLEDLYAEGSPAGQIGQEVYGSGASFVYARISHQRLEGAPFVLWSEVPLTEPAVLAPGVARLKAHGVPGTPVRVRLIPGKGPKGGLGTGAVIEIAGEETPWIKTPEGHLEATIPAWEPVALCWS